MTMKFVVLTFAGHDNNFVKELIESKLYPSLVVSESPFQIYGSNGFIAKLKRLKAFLKYLVDRTHLQNNYKAFFLAKKHKIPFWPTSKVNSDEFATLLQQMKIDFGFVFIFKMLDDNVLKATKYGFVNFHPSLLPMNRGATPINYVILNNQSKAGFTLHFICNGIDKGAIIEQYEVPVTGLETANALNQYIKNIGSIAFVRLIYKLIHNYKYSLIVNDICKGSYERPFRREHRIISENISFEEIDRVVRASRIGRLTAIYILDNREFNVINCVDLSDCQMYINQFPFVDEKNNIFLKLPDNRIALLVTN